MGKRKVEDDTFLRKKTEEKRNSATIMISEDGFSTEVEITSGIVWIKILKNRILKKI